MDVMEGSGYELDSSDAITLQSMRATYMVQLIIDVLGINATSSLGQLFANLRASTTQTQLITLDSCSMSGLQEYCGMWTDAVEQLCKGPSVRLDLRSILIKSEVNRLTPESIKLAGRSDTGRNASGMPEDDDDAPSSVTTTFTVKSLAEYGMTSSVPSADRMLQLRWIISSELLRLARSGSQQ